MTIKKTIDESRIIKLYVDEGFSGREISKKIGHALSTIQRVLKKHKVVRNLKEARKTLFKKGYEPSNKILINESEVLRLYLEEQQTVTMIANKFCCSLSPIIRIFKQNNVKIRKFGFYAKGKPGFWKGKNRPEISIKLKGKKISDETRKRLRLAHLGQKSNIKGKTYEEFYGTQASELKEKLSKSHLGQISSKRGKTFEELYGSEKAKSKIEELSLIGKKRFSSEEARKKQSERIKHFVEQHPEWKELKSKQTKKFLEDNPKYKEMHSRRMKEYYSKPDNIEANKEKMKEYYKNHPEALLKMSEIQKKIWNTPEKILYARKRRAEQKFVTKRTSPERIVMQELNARNIKFESQYRIKDNNFLCWIDLAILNRKLAIECDGDYHHLNPNRYELIDDSTYLDLKNNKIKNLTKEQIKNIKIAPNREVRLTILGWKVIHIWESDIKKDVKKCVDKIEEIMKQNIK